GTLVLLFTKVGQGCLCAVDAAAAADAEGNGTKSLAVVSLGNTHTAKAFISPLFPFMSLCRAVVKYRGCNTLRGTHTSPLYDQRSSRYIRQQINRVCSDISKPSHVTCIPGRGAPIHTVG
ncbi:unnamed protein product, partial [Ectocarpus sp. 12 AP-2014]